MLGLIRLLCIGAMASLILMQSALAFDVRPARVELSSSGSGASGDIQISNASTEPLPIEITIARRDVAADGAQELVPDERNFVVFPPQALIQPGASQAVRFQYIGPPGIERAAAYVVNVTQLPVRQPGESGVLVVYEFGVAVYVTPQGAVADPVVTASAAGDGSAEIEITNEGGRYAFLTNDTLTISAPDGDQVFEGEALNNQISNPILPPGAPRVFTIDMPGLSASDAITVTYDARAD